MTQDAIEPMVRFLHPVGKSTLRQGITVPLAAQKGWLRLIPKGESQTVQIRFDEGGYVQATLRRINNARGHLQFRYEGKGQKQLRDYLTRTFGAGKPRPNALLQIAETGKGAFSFIPVSGNQAATANLTMYKPLFHNIQDSEKRTISELHELGVCPRIHTG